MAETPSQGAGADGANASGASAVGANAAVGGSAVGASAVGANAAVGGSAVVGSAVGGSAVGGSAVGASAVGGSAVGGSAVGASAVGASAGANGADHADFDDVFELTGHGKFNCLVTLCGSLIFIHCLMEMVCLGYIIAPAECDLNLTTPQKSMVNAAVFIGIMLTAICWGVIGDLYGRRKIMLPGLVGTVLASFASSLCTHFWPMFVFRLITGLLVSASSAMSLVYVAELQNKAHMDTSVSIALASAQLGFVIVPLVGWALIPGRWSFTFLSILIRPWRVFMWFWGVIGLSGAIMLFLLPESPKFVFEKQGGAAALPILANIYSWNFKKKASDFPVKRIDVKTGTEEAARGGVMKDLSQMMRFPIWTCVWLTHLGLFVVFMLANGLYMWIPYLLNLAMAHASESINMCNLLKFQDQEKSLFVPLQLKFFEAELVPLTDTNHCKEVNWVVYPMSSGMEMLIFIPFLTVIFIINKVNKVRLYAIFMLVCGAGNLLSAFVPQCMVAMLSIIIGTTCGSCCSLLTALAVEAFPTSLRGLATCTMYMAGQLGSVVGTSLIGMMNGAMCYVLFIMLAGLCAATAFSMVLLWPNLQEVRRIMENRNYSY